MSQELEVAGAASLGGLTSGEHHPVNPKEPCRNCGAEVSERYCSRCGQLASNFHRPFFNLVASSLADTFALDSRLWRTVPMLLFRPGRVTRNYLDGKRARYVPPFRMFLLASLLFFLTVFGLGDQLGWYKDWNLDLGKNARPAAEALSEQESAERAMLVEDLQQQLQDADLSDEQRAEIEGALADLETGIDITALITPEGTIDREALNAALDEQVGEEASPAARAEIDLMANQAARVLENQDMFAARFREWAPRFSLMFMPLLALMLTVLYAWHRSIFVYDHVITALHVQTFIYGLFTLMLLCGAFLGVSPGWLATISSTWLVWYLYRQLRVAYGTGRFMAALRTSILLFLGITVLFVLGLGLVVLSFLLT